LARKGAEGAKVRADVAAMRERLQAAKPATGPWEAKNGPGRLMDIELCAEMCALLTGSPARGVERQIMAGAKCGLSSADQQALRAAYTLLWQVQCAARLLTEGALDLAALGEGGRGFVLRETEAESAEALSAALAARVALAEGVIVAQMQGG
jgi:glutamate-ammonia-ligase adenylyltransferase